MSTYRIQAIGHGETFTATSLRAAKSQLRNYWGTYGSGEIRCVGYRDGVFIGGFWIRY